MSKIFFRKTTAFLFIFLLISISFIHSIERKEENQDSIFFDFSFGEKAVSGKIIDNDCYGFVIPLPSGEDSTYETFKNSKVRHLINDLLREGITVYWSSCDFSVLSKYMDSQSFVKENYYEVPFF